MRSEDEFTYSLYVLLFYNNVNVLCTITINKHNFLFFIIDGRGGIHVLSICAGEFITKYIYFILMVSVLYLLNQFNNAIRYYVCNDITEIYRAKEVKTDIGTYYSINTTILWAPHKYIWNNRFRKCLKLKASESLCFTGTIDNW